MRPAGIRVVNVFPGPIDDEWNQLMPPPKVAPAALASAIVKALRDGVEDVYPGDVAQEWLARWRDNPKVLERELAAGSGLMNGAQILGAHWPAPLRGGRIRVVDLTQTLTPEFPQIALPPEFGQCWPFRIEEVSRYDERGPGWYWNNFSCGEHTGTHFDAPIHWISGRDLPNNAIDTIPVEHFVAPACVIDCSAQAAADPDYLLTVDAMLEPGRRSTAASPPAPGC